jgi:hypothetical protein
MYDRFYYILVPGSAVNAIILNTILPGSLRNASAISFQYLLFEGLQNGFDISKTSATIKGLDR